MGSGRMGSDEPRRVLESRRQGRSGKRQEASEARRRRRHAQKGPLVVRVQSWVRETQASEQRAGESIGDAENRSRGF